jgi:hypothetical protein
MIPKGIRQTSIPNIYFRKGNNKFKGPSLWFSHGIMNLLYYCNFIIPFGNMMFPMLTAALLYRTSSFQTQHYNSVLEILYLVDIRFCFFRFISFFCFRFMLFPSVQNNWTKFPPVLNRKQVKHPNCMQCCSSLRCTFLYCEYSIGVLQALPLPVLWGRILGHDWDKSLKSIFLPC